MSIRIRKLDDGYLVTDDRGPRVWEGAATTEADAKIMAAHREKPWTAAPPPGTVVLAPSAGTYNGATGYGGYAEAQPVTPPEACAVVQPHPLAAAQFDQATGDASCVGGFCAVD